MSSKLYPGTYSPWLETYNDVRNLYRSFRHTESVIGRPLPDDVWRDLRRSARVVYRKPARDPLAAPITEDWRSLLIADGIDAWGMDYRILPEDPDDPYTEAELTEYMHDSRVWCGSSRYDFDCTGEKLTRTWHWRRTPAGIALFHEWFINT